MPPAQCFPPTLREEENIFNLLPQGLLPRGLSSTDCGFPQMLEPNKDGERLFQDHGCVQDRSHEWVDTAVQARKVAATVDMRYVLETLLS